MLNVVGLALGMGVSIIIFMYLKSELTYDEHFPDHQKIYRVESEFKLSDQLEKFASTGHGLGPLLFKEHSYIETFTRLMHIDENVLFKYGDVRLYEDKIIVADSNFFDVFKLPFQSGQPEGCLNKAYQMVVTRSFSERYFGDADPVGKVISTNNHEYTVTGLIDDLPANTHHGFSAVISAFLHPATEDEYVKSLWQTDINTFLKFNEEGDNERLRSEFPNFYEKYMKEIGRSFGSRFRIHLTRLDEIHFGGNYQYDRPGGNITYQYAFGAIGILILVLAIINYVNMATARSFGRVKEAGMRKILGSDKREVILLVLVEALLLSFFSMLLSFVMIELTLEVTPLNKIIQKDLSLDFSRDLYLWWLPLLMALTVGLLSGWYPAWSLSKVHALVAVKGGFFDKGKGLLLRKVLVGFQFTISVSVVITALLMYRQMEYVKGKDLGFNKEDVILIPIQDTLTEKNIPFVRKKLKESPSVYSSATASTLAGSNVARTLFGLESSYDQDQYSKRVLDIMYVGLDYFKTMEISLADGRPFRKRDLRSDRNVVVVNQELVKSMGWDDPIGKMVVWGFNASGKTNYEAEVIGVAQNFNSHSLHQPIQPTVILLESQPKGILHIRVDSENLIGALNDIEKIWARIDPEKPFQFSFLDEDLMKLYNEEQRQSRLILFLTYLAIFISLLGLTGLASFTTGLRTREIGIRKVLGADVRQMINLIFRDMLVMITISVIVALPLAYFLIMGWLSNFAYSARLDPWIFIFSGALAIFLAYLIVTYHSIKVAKTNPVDTLKYE